MTTSISNPFKGKRLKPGTLTIADIRTLPPERKSKYNNSLTEEQKNEILEPCTGDAHTNPYIDHCGVCLYTTWGRQLKRG